MKNIFQVSVKKINAGNKANFVFVAMNRQLNFDIIARFIK